MGADTGLLSSRHQLVHEVVSGHRISRTVMGSCFIMRLARLAFACRLRADRWRAGLFEKLQGFLAGSAAPTGVQPRPPDRGQLVPLGPALRSCSLREPKCE